jgi:hypothetical protein
MLGVDGTGSNDQLTGFFTSRPGVKGYVRSSSITLQAARQLEVFTGGDGTGTEAPWEAIAVAQHHDAVAGTERQHVSYDYTQRIAKGLDVAYRTLDSALSRLSANGSDVVDFHSCPLLNVSICPPIRTSEDSFTVIVYNPQARPRSEPVTLPLFSATNVTVTDSQGRALHSEVVPVPPTSAHTAESASRAVTFTADLPGLGFDTFFIRPAQRTSTSSNAARLQRLRASGRETETAPPSMRGPTAATVSIENARVRLSFDNATGRLTSWTDVTTQAVHPLSQDFFYYNSSSVRNDGISTLYTFQPKPNTTLIPVTAGAVQLTVHIGSQVQFVQQRWNDWLSQTWRLSSSGSSWPEAEWTVGPIAFQDGVSREVVTKYSTDIASAGEVWTDANGREFQRRLRNKRLSFNFTLVSPISSNYYPVTYTPATRLHCTRPSSSQRI